MWFDISKNGLKWPTITLFIFFKNDAMLVMFVLSGIHTHVCSNIIFIYAEKTYFFSTKIYKLYD